MKTPSLLVAGEHAERARARIRWRSGIAAIWLVPFAVVFTLFCLAPMVWVIANSVQSTQGFTLANYAEILSSPFYRQAFGNSLRISLWSSAIGLVIAIFGAASLRRVPGRLRRLVVSVTNMTSNLTGVPLAFAFIILVGTNGSLTLLFEAWGLAKHFDLYSINGLILIYTYFQIPLGILLLYPAFDALDDDWQAAASLLGAKLWQYWRHVGLPVLAPAIFGTFILLFANAIGAYASAYALTQGNFNLITVRIAGLVSGDLFLDPNMAAALSVLLMLLLLAVTVANQWLLNRRTRHAR
ncbi:ABC transporter permease [Paraburkholderia sacchari]|uniref:ABC transporter permease n=1 Tax=Paraburkholderia sacchari TaxID=159450 RepID=UPI0005440EB1|nr:ABC transporter permease subunit [Paraburkholderia sacchari]NLP63191.1 ABC transporter permease subunit [Paraburkholderia sacchari]